MTESFNPLSALLGKRISNVLHEENWTCLVMDGGAKLIAYRKIEVIHKGKERIEASIGKKIINIREEAGLISIETEEGLRLLLSTIVDEEVSPEAIQLKVPGKPIVIWN